MTAVMRSIPDVLHIGFSKCGSTYLRALFRAHPNIKLVWKSGFFTPGLYTPNRTRPASLAEYQAMFERQEGILNVESDEHLTMPSVHPSLGVRGTRLDDFERLVKNIASLLPSVKIIMVFRNQPSLLVSRYSEYLIAGGMLEFDDFVTSLMGEGGEGNHFFQNYYSQMVAILRRYFSERQLLILAQEQMAKNMPTTELRLAEFLAIGPPVVVKQDFFSERKSLSVAGMRFLRTANSWLVSKSSFAGAPPITKCPWSVYHNVVRAIRLLDHLLLRRLSKSAAFLLAEERRLSILSHFRADNLQLEEFVGPELAKMGYTVEPGFSR